MMYVNERISDEDMVKYRIDEMAWGYASNNYRDWVIDRERDIYLRKAFLDREKTEDEFWSFHWKGYQWPVYGYWVSYIPKTDSQMAQYTVRLKFTKFPEVLLDKLDEIRADFMAAYRADTLNQNIDTTFVFE